MSKDGVIGLADQTSNSKGSFASLADQRSNNERDNGTNEPSGKVQVDGNKNVNRFECSSRGVQQSASSATLRVAGLAVFCHVACIYCSLIIISKRPKVSHFLNMNLGLKTLHTGVQR
ncbi:hypothetical protein CTI12_AA551930 [Artemisia annua]|uniref:Uncharacterized protein n=1 Tax=Artemisia annua TaxID=35608 RepID=A0A2U1KY61_ARTAN|nr:hypothetical protein CTI12_AA551930 [Artemisia annua]